MRLVKKFASAVLTAAGGLLLWTAMSRTAMAFDIAPEMDPGMITSAIAVLTSGALLLTGKRLSK
jgi:hypothetical protein